MHPREPHQIFAIFLLAQVIFYGLAALGTQMTTRTLIGRIDQIFANVCWNERFVPLGFFRWVSVPQTGMWNRTEREADAGPIEKPRPVAMQ